MSNMKSLTDTYTLSNGVAIPCVGFGTWQTPDGDVARESVKSAIAAGYRHIDTAGAYGNEESVGLGIRESGVKREELFITTKLNPRCMSGYDEAKAMFNQSLQKLGLDYLDLYLIHWPAPKANRDNYKEINRHIWRAFEEFYKEGRVRAIGVSNFYQHHIDALLDVASIAPMVDQIRLCPGDSKPELTKHLRDHKILIEAYSPMGTGKSFEAKELQDMAAKYGKSIAQVCVRWSLQMGFLPLPKSTHAERIAQNAQVFDFALDQADVDYLASLKDISGYFFDPDETPF